MDHTIERVQVPLWGWVVASAAVLSVYLMSLDNGVALQGLAERAHELFHDGRHFLGVPCH